MRKRLTRAMLVTVLALVATAAVADKPNIILCMADDQGWGDTAYNGHPYLVTPHLDAMAKAGLRFDRFYAAAPVCTPTRASVMTGRHPNRMGAFQWGHTLRPQEVTIAEALKTAGYTTGHFGKWHLGSVRPGSPVSPGGSGFDTWVSAPNFYDNDAVMSVNGIATPFKGESSIIAAIEFMNKAKADGKPFLAVVWFGSPHSPHKAVDEDLKHYAGTKGGHWAGEITGLDRAVGKLRAALRDMDIHEDTLFWYCSDNGGLRSESSGGRAKKGEVYEGGLRVPGIIEWPARIRQPRVTDAVVNTSDIYPTLLEIVGVEIDNQPRLDGVSVVPVIDGKDFTRPAMGFWDNESEGGVGTRATTLMAELMASQKKGDMDGNEKWVRKDAGKIKKQYPMDKFPGHAAWFDWPWKLHRIEPHKGKNKGKVRFELYNLAEDPMEKNDLASKERDRVNDMAHQLKQWQISVVNSLNGKDY